MSEQILRQKGFTVVELVVASGLLMAISFGAATLLPVDTNINQKKLTQVTSSSLFHQIIEEAQSIELNQFKTKSLPADGQNILLDTTKNTVQLKSSGQITGDLQSFGRHKQKLLYPRYYRIKNIDYRVDIIVSKNQPNHPVLFRHLSHSDMADSFKVEVFITPWNNRGAHLKAVVAEGSFIKAPLFR